MNCASVLLARDAVQFEDRAAEVVAALLAMPSRFLSPATSTVPKDVEVRQRFIEGTAVISCYLLPLTLFYHISNEGAACPRV